MLWSRHFVHYSDAFHYSGVCYSGVSLYLKARTQLILKVNTVKHRNNGHLNNGMHRNNGQSAYSGAPK